MAVPPASNSSIRELAGLRLNEQIVHCLRLRPRTGHDSQASTRRALRSLASRWQTLDREIRELERELDTLTKMAAPRLLAEPGIGPETAARLLVIASDNPG